MIDMSQATARRAEDTARLLRALGNPQRLLILCRLLKVGEASAGDLARHFGLAPSALSQHLARMREEGLVIYRRQTRTLLYRLRDVHGGRLPVLLESICDESDEGDASTRADTPVAAALSFAFASSGAVVSDSICPNPTITAAGQIHALPHAAYQPDPDATCKVVFGMTRGSENPGQLNPALQRVARTVNLYAHAGVSLDQLKLIGIASGAATAMALDDTHYKNQYGIDNPNLPVIRELRESGVDIAVCGQAVAEHQYRHEWIDSHVTVALSALTTIIELQQKGYALMPL